VVLLGAGGFVERAVRCLWEEMPRAGDTRPSVSR
jgi:hypothetical protein